MDMENRFLFELKDQDIKLSVHLTDLRVKLVKLSYRRLAAWQMS